MAAGDKRLSLAARFEGLCYRRRKWAKQVDYKFLITGCVKKEPPGQAAKDGGDIWEISQVLCSCQLLLTGSLRCLIVLTAVYTAENIYRMAYGDNDLSFSVSVVAGHCSWQRH